MPALSRDPDEEKVDPERTPGQDVAVLDLDHFRRINECHGHLGGDAALVAVATMLRETARENDLLARWGGDELAWLMPDTSLEEALKAADRFRRQVSDGIIHLENRHLALTVSVGVAAWQPGMTGDDLLEAADNRLHDAKIAGRNMVRPEVSAAAIEM